jgi:hypothetical protein
LDTDPIDSLLPDPLDQVELAISFSEWCGNSLKTSIDAILTGGDITQVTQRIIRTEIGAGLEELP